MNIIKHGDFMITNYVVYLRLCGTIKKKSHSEINLAGGFGMRLDSTSEKSQGVYMFILT